MTIPESFTQLALMQGVKLSAINPGSQEVALPRGLAIQALNCLVGTSVGVAGGDVLKISNGGLEYVYANWHCDQRGGETSQQYADRSVRQAIDYVKNFAPAGGYEPLFVLVLAET
jgi:Immunity protein 40